MKQLFISTSLLFLIVITSHAQFLYELQPGPEDANDAVVFSIIKDGFHHERESLTAYTWTYQGALAVKRFYISFDLSEIPDSLEIQKAELSLYFNDTDPFESFDEHHGINPIRMYRVTEPWEESELNWNNQPEIDIDNFITLPPSSSTTQDYLNIDVTDLFIELDGSPKEQYGMLIRMVDEQDFYRSVLFASSNHQNPAKRPKLTLTLNEVVPPVEPCDLDEIIVFPNPTSGNVTIKENSSDCEFLRVAVFNNLGQLIIKQQVKDLSEIHIPIAGSFFIRVSKGNDHVVRPVIVY